MSDDARRSTDVSRDGDEDPALGGLVREIADDWRMPPQRLGEQTWRERIDSGGRPGSLARPALAAIALAAAATVVLALGAVWLSARPLPSGGVGASPSPGTPASPTPGSSPGASSTITPSWMPLPVAQITDPALRSLTFPVQAGDERRILVLSSGRLGSASLDGTGGYPSTLLRYGAGTVCLCARGATKAGVFKSLAVDLIERDASGTVTRSVPLTTFTGGVPDPVADGASQPVAVATSVGPTTTTAYLGWSVRRADGWASGVDLVDLRAGRVVQTTDLPPWPLTAPLTGVSGPVDRPSFADAPTVFLSPSGAHVVIEQLRGAYAVAPGGALGDGVRKGPDHWSAPVAAGRLGALTTFASGDGTLDPEACAWSSDEALVSDDVFAAACPPGSSLSIRRVDLGGRPLGDVALTANTQGFVAFADAAGGIRYAWLPFSRTLLKVDLGAGRIVGRLEVPSATALAPGLGGLMARIGAWIAPSADAKVYFQPALALSPDGSRLYVLGTKATDLAEAGAGSAGIDVVDTASMSVVARWSPTADFVSIAVSRDGRYVFAAGTPGVDESGNQRSDQGASVTVFRASDGTWAAIVGQLGANAVTLLPELMP